jgi:hypothetical protein
MVINNIFYNINKILVILYLLSPYFYTINIYNKNLKLDICLNNLSISSNSNYLLLFLKSVRFLSSLVLILDISLIPISVFNNLFFNIL